MDGHKTLVPDWQTLLATLRDRGEHKQADEIEAALNEEKTIKAVKLARACGLIPVTP